MTFLCDCTQIVPVCTHLVSCRMPDNIEELRENFRQMNKSAFVLGYTGEVGKELVKELLTSKVFSRVTLIGRRRVPYEDELRKDVVCPAGSSTSLWSTCGKLSF